MTKASIADAHGDEIDVTDWAVIRDEPGGRDPNKRWLAPDPDAPRQEHWLWKSRQITASGDVHALTDCAEVVASRLAGLLGIPAADCRYAVHDGELGLVSRNVAPEGFSLNTGAAYLPEVVGYVRQSEGSAARAPVGRMHRDEGYTLDAVERVLSGVNPPPGLAGFTAFGAFAGYLVLDALVGNSDRHPGNWALLESETGERFLAPTYDHGTALGAGLTDENRRVKDPAAFARRGRANPFTPRKQSLVDLSLTAVRRADAAEWLRRLARLDDSGVRAILDAPGQRLSVVASTFMERVVLENRRRLCDDNAAQD
ncbi:hypothetical protein BCE75_103184 [Isoptericola sp. CG 20/1183]|uniref:HipA-like C-terminal domain-containing protein n=1 Tax=Isoptericola halotolerans TaxID=300560 RepID=A0ABX5EFT2_9MICO|nr:MULTISPECIES: hypothetical protein [Isoptericola]PRZ08257.1 hypothetical protein BCL65_103185 [Isoptericola halotolerans]PRZ09054.1 hypothetical protein BCE75_103184 [Isoptericola sp. CG 20/1183]